MVLYSYAIVGILAFNDEVSVIDPTTNGTIASGGCTSSICQDYFQNIYQAMFTMFQVMSGDSWLSGITREGESKIPYFSFLFFGSFYIFTTMILLNLLTGIILDAIQGGENDLDQLKKNVKKPPIKIDDDEDNDNDVDEKDEIELEDVEFEEKSEMEQVTEKVDRIKNLLNSLEDNFNLFIAAKISAERSEVVIKDQMESTAVDVGDQPKIDGSKDDDDKKEVEKEEKRNDDSIVEDQPKIDEIIVEEEERNDNDENINLVVDSNNESTQVDQ